MKGKRGRKKKNQKEGGQFVLLRLSLLSLLDIYIKSRTNAPHPKWGEEEKARQIRGRGKRLL